MLRLNDILDQITSYNPDADLDLIKKAYVYSAKVHAGQLRKSGEPYLIHPLEVAGLLAQLKLDVTTIATGLLHDTVEDTLATLDEIDTIFNSDVAFLVDGLTKLSKIEFKSKLERQAENFRKMIIAMAKDMRILLIKLTDRLHNMRTMQYMKKEKQAKIAAETLSIYAPLANRLGISWIKSELEDLSFKYLYKDEYNNIADLLVKKEQERKTYVDKVIKIIKDELGNNSVKTEITGRAKHIYSIYRKMQSQNLSFDQVHDLTAFRILTDNDSQCYEAMGYIHNMWTPVPGRFKDYIAMPKPNLYRSLHTTVIGPFSERVEVQIRTHEMHRIAEEGIAAHWRYKEGDKRSVKKKDDLQFGWLRRLMEWQKDVVDPKEFLETVKVDLFGDEVFVFTPEGEVKELPRGACPLDFAYAVHTQVGERCVGAKVNNKIVPLKYKLRNGDLVEILTSPSSRPNKDWLDFVKSSRARTKIRAFIKKEQRERSKVIAKELLERELRKYGKSYTKLFKSGELDKTAKDSKYQSVDDMLVSLGYGKVTVQHIIELILPDLKADEPVQTKTFGLDKLFKKVIPKGKSGVEVDGVEDIMVRYAKCCNPLPGDSIIGFITRGRGITVHLANCPKITDTDLERRVDVTWKVSAQFTRSAKLRVITVDKPGILTDISKTISLSEINISGAHCRTTGNSRAINTFDLIVTDLRQLKSIIKNIRKLKGVYSVERVTSAVSSRG